jgi:hypothetical protein
MIEVFLFGICALISLIGHDFVSQGPSSVRMPAHTTNIYGHRDVGVLCYSNTWTNFSKYGVTASRQIVERDDWVSVFGGEGRI